MASKNDGGNVQFHTVLLDNSRAIVGNCNSFEIVTKQRDEKEEKCKGNTAAGTQCQETTQLPEMEGFSYEMTKGFVAVIHNTEFRERSEVWRKGSEKDVEALQKFFEIYLGFEFRVFEECTAKRMLDVAKDLSEKDLTKWDSFFFIVLSHGTKEGILGVDEKPVPVDAITGLFTADKCPSLTDKPKVFLIQACRGEREDRGAFTTDSGVFQPSVQQILPVESDFLVAFSTPPGYTSFRSEEDGSVFMQTMVNIFQGYSAKEHLMDMLLRVNFVIAKYFCKGQLKQMPIQECRLTKKCFFFKCSKDTFA